MNKQPFHGASGNGYGSRSTPGLARSDLMYSKGGYGGRSPVGFPSTDELIGEAVDSVSRSGGGDSISVTIRFRPLSEREYHRGDEVAWYADGDKLVRNEYNPVTSYAFDRVFGSSAITQEVYEVAARPVVKSAMEGVNGTVFAYGVTSSGKTHTMHVLMYTRGNFSNFNLQAFNFGFHYLLNVVIYFMGSYVVCFAGSDE